MHRLIQVNKIAKSLHKTGSFIVENIGGSISSTSAGISKHFRDLQKANAPMPMEPDHARHRSQNFVAFSKVAVPSTLI